MYSKDEDVANVQWLHGPSTRYYWSVICKTIKRKRKKANSKIGRFHKS